MTRTQADNWSIARSLAFLAATFAIVLGTLLPFGAMAATQPGYPLVLCSAEGPQVIQVGADLDGPGGKTHPAKCAACVMPLLAAIPTPPMPEPAVAVSFRPDNLIVKAPSDRLPPTRAPPRPPSTAPPQS